MSNDGPPPAVKRRLAAFLQRHCPQNLPNIDIILGHFEGNETAMFNSLVAKYGPEPTKATDGGAHVVESGATLPHRRDTTSAEPLPPGASQRISDYDHDKALQQRLGRFFSWYNPSLLSSISKIVSRTHVDEAILFSALTAKYGPEPAEAKISTFGERTHQRSVYAIDPPEEFLCGVCIDVWVRPVELIPCRHVFCEPCCSSKGLMSGVCPVCHYPIEARAAPNRILVNLMDCIKAGCSSCGWRGPWEEGLRHSCK